MQLTSDTATLDGLDHPALWPASVSETLRIRGGKQAGIAATWQSCRQPPHRTWGTQHYR